MLSISQLLSIGQLLSVGQLPYTLSGSTPTIDQDFNAPEHAPAMLKFVKRINEAWSGSSPILVHCSAGVGRSGTLIAIDSLTQVILLYGYTGSLLWIRYGDAFRDPGQVPELDLDPETT